MPAAGSHHAFVGISITPAQAQQLLPRAWQIHPPVRRGDIEHIVHTNAPAGVIAIVDGVFHQTESVSLTEIRLATQRGWALYGAASMGALRAVEAAPLGMHGVGTVFSWLTSGVIQDDDEVAQAVHPTTFAPLSDALVDIRALLQQLIADGLIDGATSAACIARYRQRPYRDRHLQDVVADLRAEIAPALHHRLDASRAAFVSIKHQDAVTLLRTLGAPL